jgi:hypothetical protein
LSKLTAFALVALLVLFPSPSCEKRKAECRPDGEGGCLERYPRTDRPKEARRR